MSVARHLDELLKARYITRGMSLRSLSRDVSPWSYTALQGRLVSMLPGSMNAPISALFQVVWDAQNEGETVAWVGGTHSCFFPPDAARQGVDLNAIAVIRLSSDKDIWFAADTLIRSGGVGMVIIDLASPGIHNVTGEAVAKGTLALQHRLSGLARTHNTAVIIIPGKHSHDSSGALVSLTINTCKSPPAQRTGAYLLKISPKKDKNGTSNWKMETECDVPDGLC